MADDSTQPPVSPETLLRYLIGALFCWMLFGISTVQLYIYHVSFPRDRFAIRASVYTIFALDIFQSIVVACEAWQTLCAGWGRPVNLQFPGWTFTGLPIVSSVISIWVQTFYAWRIYQLGKWRVVPIIIMITALAQAGAACAIAISFISLKDIERLHDTDMFARTIVWLGGSAFTDMTIMISMVYLLYNVREKTRDFERSEFMTGCACALSAVLELGFFLGLPDTNIHLIIALILSKVYSNTLMTSLNSRANIAGTRSVGGNSLSMSRSIGFNGFATTVETATTMTAGGAGEGLAAPDGKAVAVHISRAVDSDRSAGSADDKYAEREPVQNWPDLEMNDVRARKFDIASSVARAV
ncbi:uncharacterized protein BXZ73DRAFT_89798 [Epithele typhae]|uniref:uncharacterized protein n=1 Tax=Epithele typhae TaxID=378194 RepID=UPI002007DBEA|nr:uncharacterized protein BXZ73DRAFT_89798 [Epithele typhae]KAH9933136.1 hypothetical protein BXZ73DRAFT_89798 [Epithele typhae]